MKNKAGKTDIFVSITHFINYYEYFYHDKHCTEA